MSNSSPEEDGDSTKFVGERDIGFACVAPVIIQRTWMINQTKVDEYMAGVLLKQRVNMNLGLVETQVVAKMD